MRKKYKLKSPNNRGDKPQLDIPYHKIKPPVPEMTHLKWSC